ncbi:hypothetical protein [Chitinimonas sp. BJB300]|uniref:hypothetical protein n=1 Tax=Chitinimonas sp. BJB300 TaxID=1559339 RepID=UPI001304041C|nr:hypothetical protein [Chitinimonas sp. BJB300]
MPTSKIEAMWHLVLTQRNQILQTREESGFGIHQSQRTDCKLPNTATLPTLARPRQAFA